jgi:polysaccharide pyruvyl transferase WcaK-like protein
MERSEARDASMTRLRTSSNGKTVCIIGNYSGRNAGDAAMLEGILRDVSGRFDQLRFVVPTLITSFVRRAYRAFNVRAVSLAPWALSVKLWGLPLFWALGSADLILITDAILFDVNLFNPLHNYLLPLSFWLPWAARRGIPVVLYNVSIGPVATRNGQSALKRVLKASRRVILRDEQSLKTLAAVGFAPASAQKGADCALLAEPAPAERVDAILRERGISPGRPRIGVNMNAYGSSFLRRSDHPVTSARAVAVLAEAIRWMRAELNADVWLFSTQAMDETVVKELAARVGADAPPVFSNRRYSHNDLLGLLSRVDLLVGMRTHSIILASSVGTPVVGMITYPKTAGYLERIGQLEHSLHVDDLTLENLQARVRQVWAGRSEWRAKTRHAADAQRTLARDSSKWLAEYLASPSL